MCECNENHWCVTCQTAELDEYFGRYDKPTNDLIIANDVWEQVDDANGERDDPFANAVGAIDVDWDDLPF